MHGHDEPYQPRSTFVAQADKYYLNERQYSLMRTDSVRSGGVDGSTPHIFVGIHTFRSLSGIIFIFLRDSLQAVREGQRVVLELVHEIIDSKIRRGAERLNANIDPPVVERPLGL